MPVEKLRPAARAPRRHRSNNHARVLYSDDDDSDNSDDSDDDSDDDNDAAEDSPQSEGGIGDVLAKLQQLDSELASDSSDWSERALAGNAPSEWSYGVSTRGASARVGGPGASTMFCPATYSPRLQVPDTSLAGAGYRYALAPFSTGIGLRRKTTPTALHSPAANAASDTSRWLFSGPRSTFPSQR